MSVELLILFLATVSGPDTGDQELALKIREGDHEAFRQFFDRHHAALTGFLRRKNIPDEAASDIIQQAFITIWESRERIDPGKSLRAYLYQIGLTRSLNYFRDQRKFVGAEADGTGTYSGQGSSGFVTEAGAAQQPNPEELTSASEMRAALHAAVQELPDKRRQVFELCFVQEFTYREAAETLEISVKTVENQMGAALKSIREAMKKFLEG